MSSDTNQKSRGDLAKAAKGGRLAAGTLTFKARSTLVDDLHVVSIGEMRANADGRGEIITYGLGSCLGITVYDPVARVGGLLHAMLPSDPQNGTKTGDNSAREPYRFVNTGVPLLFKACYALGAKKERMELRVAGGARIGDGPDSFQIGKRNFLALKKLLWRNNVLIKAAEVGGNVSRTMSLCLASGKVTLSVQGNVRVLR